MKPLPLLSRLLAGLAMVGASAGPGAGQEPASAVVTGGRSAAPAGEERAPTSSPVGEPGRAPRITVARRLMQKWSSRNDPPPAPTASTIPPARTTRGMASIEPVVVRTAIPQQGDQIAPTPLVPNPGQRPPVPPSGPVPNPMPAPPPAEPGSATGSRGMIPPPIERSTEAESSARELAPGAGEIFIPPPPIPPVPPGMRSAESADAEARTREPLTLEALERLACQNNPTLKQARAQVEVEFGTAIQAGLWPNPSLSYIESGINPTPGGFLGATVTQTIPTAGKKRIDRARWLEATKAAQWNAMSVEYRVLNDIRRFYFWTLAMQAYVEVQKELVQNAEDEVVSSREGYNMGVDNRQVMHGNNATLQEQRLKYLQYQNMYRQMSQRLMATAGVQMPFTPMAGELEGDTTPVEWDATLDRYFKFSPEIQAAYADLRFEQLNLKLQRVQPWPNIQVVGGVGYNYSNQLPVEQFQVHLIGVPTWNWNQGFIRRANAHILRQQGEVKRIQLRLQDDLALVYQAYLTAIQHVESYQKVILPELRRNYELALDSYEDDRQTWTNVLAAQRKYYEARQTYATHLVTWRMNEVLIVGFLLSGGLSPAPSGLPPGHALTGLPAPAQASQFVSPGTFLFGP